MTNCSNINMLPIEQDNFMEDYSHQLGLRWHVDMNFAYVDRPQITVDPLKQIHHINIPFHYQIDKERFDCDRAHELTHAYFAERIDPIFATTYFHSLSGIIPGDIQSKRIMVSHAQQLIDIWVSDKMFAINPNLIRQDIDSWNKETLSLLDWQLSNFRIETVIGYALNKASIVRYGLREFSRKAERGGARIKNIFGKDIYKIAQYLTKLYTSLPELPLDKDLAIPLFEENTQKAAQILEYPIMPVIAMDLDGRNIWRF